jgi:hypothetical protein
MKLYYKSKGILRSLSGIIRNISIDPFFFLNDIVDYLKIIIVKYYLNIL